MRSMMVPSAAMRRLRREAIRIRLSLASAGGIAKKQSPPPLCSAPTAPPGSRANGDTQARPSPLAMSCPRHAAAPPFVATIKNSSLRFSKGARVRVRTPVGTLRTGRGLVLWLSAVVVSAAEEEDGYLDVAYSHHKHPRSDPSGTVRVPMNDVKNMPPPAAAIDTAASAGSSDVTDSPSATLPGACPSNGTAALRPTVAGKKPSLLKKMEEEMRRKSEAILDTW